MHSSWVRLPTCSQTFGQEEEDDEEADDNPEKEGERENKMLYAAPPDLFKSKTRKKMNDGN